LPPYQKKPDLLAVHPSAARPSSNQKIRRFLAPFNKGFSFVGHPLLVTVFSESARRFPFLYQKYASIGKQKKVTHLK